jgi:hypothetical protein
LRRVAPVPGEHEPMMVIQRLLASSAQFSVRRTRGRRHVGLQYKSGVSLIGPCRERHDCDGHHHRASWVGNARAAC